MLPTMRRAKQELSKEQCEIILRQNTSGVLALDGDGGYPYALPISYVYVGDTIYFHAATAGHKLSAITRNPKASFCVIGQDQVAPEQYTTYYRSVIVFGAMTVVEDDTEKRAAALALAAKYSPDETAEHTNAEIEDCWKRFHILRLTVHHMTGKQAMELVED